MKIMMLENEHWYGGFVTTGDQQPFHEATNLELDLTVNTTPNQGMPLFLSSKGRYIWRDTGFVIQFHNGSITLPDDVLLAEGYKTLKGAYLAAMNKHFPTHEIKLADILFEKPQYNSWIELVYDQNETDILNYAQNILSNGFEPGILMIDDGWSDYYGDWVFSKNTFPNAQQMLHKLKDLGFTVMLWVCPFVTPDTKIFREASDLDLLLKTQEDKPFICEWWNGYSAVYDFSNPKTVAFFEHKLDKLMEMGISGFKFDAGDSYFYPADVKAHLELSPNEHCKLWAEFGEKYELNEYRASFMAAGMSLMQRLGDKNHSWDANGLSTIIPHTLTLGITGHPFSCPDMIGGGEFSTFLAAEKNGLDQELFCRHSQAACMLPAMQFSAAPWRVLSDKNCKLIQKSVAVRNQYIKEIMSEVNSAKKTGEPIIRYMEYCFPGQGFEKITDQFMLGDHILVAPIVHKGETKRNVAIPKGTWEWQGNLIVSEGIHKVLTPPEGEPIILIAK